jgi:DNA repair exonuclease SbcCD ATPase subunit
MKSHFTIAFLILIPFAGTKAQQPVVVSDDSLKIGNSLLPGLSVTIPEVNYDKTLKVWLRDLQAGTKSKVITENGEMSIFGAKIKAISPNPINIYSKLMRLDSMLQLFVSFEKKKDMYVVRASGDADYSKAQDYLKEFAKDQYIEVAKDQADAEEKKLRDLQKELSSLENEKSRMQKSIQSDNSSILSEKDNITIQNNELANVSAALIEQNNLLATMEAGPAQKEKADQIKELEKRKKKALNSIESSENKINRANSGIDKDNNDIPRNEKMQENVRQQIIQQEAVYQKYADKLKKIKAY